MREYRDKVSGNDTNKDSNNAGEEGRWQYQNHGLDSSTVDKSLKFVYHVPLLGAGSLHASLHWKLILSRPASPNTGPFPIKIQTLHMVYFENWVNSYQLSKLSKQLNI